MDYDKIMENFFGISLEKQIQFIETVKNNSNIDEEIKEEFNNLFDDYYDEIKKIVEANKLYSTLNSDQRRYLRLRIFKEFTHEFEKHHCDNSVENQIAYFRYYHQEDFCSRDDFNKEVKRYFNPEIISNEDADKYIAEFNNMNNNMQNLLVDDMNTLYFNLYNFRINIPFTQNIVSTYNEMVVNILGKDFSEYYNLLYPSEKLALIKDIAHAILIVGRLRNLNKEAIIIKDKDALKKQKAKSLEECKFRLRFM